MLFNTMQYFLFLTVVVFVYYILPKKVRYIWLLISSYYFYMQWNPLYVMLLLACTIITYTGGIIIGRAKHPKICLTVCILLTLGLLGYYKYFSMAVTCLNSLLHLVKLREVNWNTDILLPIGISFYTLQSLGYLIDVYRGDIAAEKNFFKYALFISFFPQLVAGPIERSKHLMKQLNEHCGFQYDNLRKGILLILYGLFLKMVIADRASIIVDTVYMDSALYPGCYVLTAVYFFAIQIYCDFYGYSTIARGSALLMGICLTDNFKAPYFSQNIKEFWHRWHISLSDWFRDYLYIPLGGNRKGMVRKERNIMIVSAASGIWHGASLSFLVWGMLNGIYQVIGDISVMVKQAVFPGKISNYDRFSRRLFRTAATFILLSFAWLFFRAGSLETAKDVLINMFSAANFDIFFDGLLYQLGVEAKEFNVLLISIVVLFVVDYQKYREKNIVEFILKQGYWFRYLVYAALFFTILIYGCYGEMYNAPQFIYFQF